MENTRPKPFQITPDLLAGNSIRFANYLLDGIVFYVFLIICMFIVLFIAGFVSDGVSPLLDIENDVLVMYGITFVVFTAYYWIFEYYFSRSVGKFVTGTMVVYEDGTKADARQILIRTVCRFIPFEVFSFLGTPGKGWHDSISRTYVVNKAQFERSRELQESFEHIGETNSNF